MPRIPRYLQKSYDKDRNGIIDKTASIQSEPQVDSVAADVTTLKNDFNALLAKLRAAGIMKQ